MAQSILISTKKVLGIAESDTSFDVDVLMHINTVLATLTQIGIGPTDGFMIEDDSATWDDFIGIDPRLNAAKTYVYLRVKMVFDPPQTSFVIDSMNKQIEEFTWRLNVQREGELWTAPVSL